MRQETNNEMDLLLRRLSRRQGVPTDGDSHSDLNHLDADELSSYAENALPAAARARYTEHLAECSSCRELIVRLSASVPIIAARETVTMAEASGLRKFLASFFSPMVLRYAVPALGLIVVAAIGFVVLRSNRQGEYVAQVGDKPGANAPLQGAASTPSEFYDSQTRTESSKAVAGARDAESPKVDSSKDARPITTTPNAAPAGAASKPESTPASVAVAAEREAIANTAPGPVAPAPKPAPTVDEMRVEVHGRRANEPPTTATASADVSKQKAAEEDKEQQKKTEVAGAASRRAQRAPSPQTGGTTSLYSVEDRAKDRDDGVTRSVGGRRFRKQNGVWVDTAYNSANRIVDVSRSSEQFRALVADEPTIKTIADELEGTIVVVWKGSTYRIR